MEGVTAAERAEAEKALEGVTAAERAEAGKAMEGVAAAELNQRPCGDVLREEGATSGLVVFLANAPHVDGISST